MARAAAGTALRSGTMLPLLSLALLLACRAAAQAQLPATRSLQHEASLLSSDARDQPWSARKILQTNSTNSTTFKVDHRVLVLSIPNWPQTDFMTTVMDGYGIPYTVVRVSASNASSITTLLTKPDGSGAYSAIFMYPSLDLGGYLTAAQVKDLYAYQAKYKARMLRPGVWPWSFAFDPPAACTSGASNMTFSAAAPMGVSGVSPTARLNTTNLYRCPGVLPAANRVCAVYANDFATTGILTACNSTVVMTNDGTPQTMAAAVINYADGRQDLISTFDCGAWKADCLVFAHFATSWLLKDLLPGQRRVLLNLQVDDLFLATELYNTNPLIEHRSGVPELTGHASWQQGLNSKLPAGSAFKLEMAFNGNGILEDGGLAYALDIGDGECNNSPAYTALGCTCAVGLVTYATCTSTVPFCKNCTKDWKMPEGFGVSLVPARYSSTSWVKSDVLGSSDAAAAVASNATIRAAFNWVSHTFTHQNLNNATAFDSQKQWTLNQDMAKLLGLDTVASYSSKGAVTPQISGLSSVNNLKAMVNANYTTAVGDNTWPYLKNLDKPYQMLRTTVAGSNYAGFQILPRFATEIYFNTDTIARNLALYNSLYTSFFGRASTFPEVLEREAQRVLGQALFALRHDPHMFHQANLALVNSNQSLIMLWAEYMLKRLGEYTTWPVESLKMDDLIGLFLQREQRDNCKLGYTLTVTSGAVTGVTMSSAGGTGSCAAPIMSRATAALAGSGIANGPNAGSGINTKVVTVPAGGSASVTATGVPW